MSWYSLLLYLHIFSAILSIGPFFVLIPLLAKMKKVEFSLLPLYMESFRFVVRLTKHSGHILVTTGVLLIWLGPWTWKTSWVVATILVLVSSLFFLARAFSPILRKLSAPDHNRAELMMKLQRALILYIVITMTMLWFMVGKPHLWG